MSVKSLLFLGLSFIAFTFIACSEDQQRLHPYPAPPPSLAWITIPTEELPANSRLMVASIPGMDPDSVEIHINGIGGTVTSAYFDTQFVFKPASTLPLGKAIIEVQGTGRNGRDFSAINPPTREIEVIAPDSAPPILVGTEPPDKLTALLFRESDVLFVFSEPIVWFNAKASFEPNVVLDLKNKPMEIQSEVSGSLTLSGIVSVALTYPLRFQKGISYQVTLQGITDLAENPAGEVQRIYTLP